MEKPKIKVMMKKQEDKDKPVDNLKDLVVSMRIGSVFYKDKCEKEEDILIKCIYCKYYLSSQTYGPLLQEYLKKKNTI